LFQLFSCNKEKFPIVFINSEYNNNNDGMFIKRNRKTNTTKTNYRSKKNNTEEYLNPRFVQLHSLHCPIKEKMTMYSPSICSTEDPKGVNQEKT
jgi:hypothetical protein